MECFIHPKHSLNFFYKSKHFPGRYSRKREWVFFSEHSVHHQKPYLQLFFGCGFRLLFTQYNDYNMTVIIKIVLGCFAVLI